MSVMVEILVVVKVSIRLMMVSPRVNLGQWQLYLGFNVNKFRTFQGPHHIDFYYHSLNKSNVKLLTNVHCCV